MDQLEFIYQNQYSFGKKINTPFGLRYITYADFIASGQVLHAIEQFMCQQVFPVYANTHTEASFTGSQTTHFREEARQIIKDSVNASQEDVLIFSGSGSTGAINKLFLKMLQRFEEDPKPTAVFIGPYEHHSNVLPWRESKFELIEVPINAKGGIDTDFLIRELEKKKTTHNLIGSFSAASNVTGIISPVDEINEILKSNGALAFWDFAGGAPYMHIDMNPGGLKNKDAIFISPHKLVGGPGTPGILIVKRSLFEGKKPVIPGGGTVQFVSKWSHGYINDIEAREEGGTPDIIGAIRAGLAFKLKSDIGTERIETIETQYIESALKRLHKHQNIRILGSLELKRLSFLSFHIRHNDKLLHHNFIVALLNDLFGIQARGGCSCAGPYGHDLLGIDEFTSTCYLHLIENGDEGFKPGWVRLNLNYFIPEQEVEFILQSIEWIADHGYKLLHIYAFEVESGLWRYRDFKPELASLSTFKLSDAVSNSSPLKKDMQTCMNYISEASEVAEKSWNTRDENSFQNFNFNQEEEEMRWFLVPQDLD